MPLQRWGGFEIAHRIALPDLAKAHELMERPGRRGRIVLAIGALPRRNVLTSSAGLGRVDYTGFEAP